MKHEQIGVGGALQRAGRLAGLTALAAALVACSPQALLVREVADQLARQGGAPEDDLALAREAAAFYLKFSESVLARSPGHLALAEAVAGGFTQYAYGFVAFEAERIESRDARAAQRLLARAAGLYSRAHRHAMAALEQDSPGFARRLASAERVPPDRSLRLSTAQVGVAYWAAASWGAHIALSKDKPDVVADLPQAVRLARLAWECSPDHAEGALSSLMGSLEAARPGGSADQARVYFERAIVASGGRSAGPYVAQAEALAQPAGDRVAFEALLRRALLAAGDRRDLSNALMRERAQWLLDTVDDRF